MIIQTLNTLEIIDFDQFIAWYPEKAGCSYELHQGVIVEMPKPKGKHSQIAGFLMTELGIEIRRLNFPYFVPRECIIKENDLSGYETDVIVLDVNQIKNESRWEKESIIMQGQSIALVIEVVSSNWSDDYALKFDVYEELGIREYWIIDYLGLGGRKFIGLPKQPTLTINQLVEGEYQSYQFRGSERVISSVFKELNLTA